jgi:GntR family transcriptional regulator
VIGIAWELDDERPIYLQLAEQICLRIISGRYAPGERLPSVRELAAEAAVNPNTMQRALGELESCGLVITQRTVGRTVTDDRKTINAERRKIAERYTAEFTSKMKELGLSQDEIRNYMEEALK